MMTRPGPASTIEMSETDAAPLLAEGWVRVDAGLSK
jgi:hypothetical protein